MASKLSTAHSHIEISSNWLARRIQQTGSLDMGTMNMNNLQKLKRDRSLPAHYNPNEGLKTMAAAEAAENFYRRAKDSTGLYAAVEMKLTEQRNFVLWWDGTEKSKGAAQPRRNRSVTTLKRADLPVDPMQLSRWRTRLKDDEKFEKSLVAAQERCRRTCEAEKGSSEQKGASGTGEQEWYTPVEYIEMARTVLGTIDLDPASSLMAQTIVKATTFYTAEENGLMQPWNGRVWLNPPYKQPLITEFVIKLAQELNAGNTTSAILLTHNYTDTSWFHLAAGICNVICFTCGRIRFISNDGDIGQPTQGQAFFYFGQNTIAFYKHFNTIGFIAEVRH